MISRIFIAMLASLSLAGVALSDDRIGISEGRHSCTRPYTLCEAVGATGVCGGSGNERFARVGSYSYHQFWVSADGTDATSFSVSLYYTGEGDGYNATFRTGINSTPISTSQYSFVFDGLLGDVYADVTAISGGTPTLTLKGRSCAFN